MAAIEIVSPSNEDRPENRRAFVAKCAALLRERVSVSIVNLVTNRTANLHRELLEFLGGADPCASVDEASISAVACRTTRKESEWLIENWMYPLTIGQPLPTLPLWLADDLAVPVNLEATYEETCRILRIP